MVCRETGAEDSFDEPGFFSGNVGSVPKSDLESLNNCFSFDMSLNEILSNLIEGKTILKQLVNQIELQDRSWLYKTLQFMIGDAVRMLPSEKVQENGLGSLWLLYRYIANVELKHGETYLFDSPEKFDYEPLAFELNQGHLKDEARHYTTSFDLGLELYKAAPPEAQDFIRHFLEKVLENYISAAFATYWEKLNFWEQGIIFTDLRVGLNSLRMSLQHPEFADKQVEINQLFNSWRQMNSSWRNVIGSLEQKSWQYKSQQLERLIKALELNLNTTKLGNRYERYKDAIEAKEIKTFIQVAE
jgi:hypothetical protein